MDSDDKDNEEGVQHPLREKALRNYGDPPRRVSPIDTDEARGGARHKNRRRWCRGRVGVEHKYEWKENVKWTTGVRKFEMFEQLTCTVCGREEYGMRGTCMCCGAVRERWLFEYCKKCRDKNGQWREGHGTELAKHGHKYYEGGETFKVKQRKRHGKKS